MPVVVVSPTPKKDLSSTNLNVERDNTKEIVDNLSAKLKEMVNLLNSHKKAATTATGMRTSELPGYANLLHDIAEQIYNIDPTLLKKLVKTGSPAFYNDLIPKEGILVKNPKTQNYMWGKTDEKDIKNIEIQKTQTYSISANVGSTTTFQEFVDNIARHIFAIQWILYQLKNPNTEITTATSVRTSAVESLESYAKEKDLGLKPKKFDSFIKETMNLLEK
jgi:hypothetical protein